MLRSTEMGDGEMTADEKCRRDRTKTSVNRDEDVKSTCEDDVEAEDVYRLSKQQIADCETSLSLNTQKVSAKRQLGVRTN